MDERFKQYLEGCITSKNKVTVHYDPWDFITYINVGESASVLAMDHPSMNGIEVVTTSRVLAYDEDTGNFETRNTLYVPCHDCTEFYEADSMKGIYEYEDAMTNGSYGEDSNEFEQAKDLATEFVDMTMELDPEVVCKATLIFLSAYLASMAQDSDGNINVERLLQYEDSVIKHFYVAMEEAQRVVVDSINNENSGE